MHYTQIRKIMIMMIKIRKEEREQGGRKGNREKKEKSKGGDRESGVVSPEMDQWSLEPGPPCSYCQDGTQSFLLS
jgi:hypothetical protein